MCSHEACDGPSMHVVAPTTFVAPTLQPSVRDLALRGAGLPRPGFGVAQPDDIDAADPLTGPAQLFVWCLAVGWTALRMSARATTALAGTRRPPMTFRTRVNSGSA